MAAIRAAQLANVLDSRQRLLAENIECLRDLQVVYGQELRELPDDALADLEAASREVVHEEAAANEDFGKVLKSLQHFGRKR